MSSNFTIQRKCVHCKQTFNAKTTVTRFCSKLCNKRFNAVNLKGVFFTLQKLLPLLSDGGSVIFNTSVNASVGMPNAGVYSASKAAVIGLSRVLATELSVRKIRVNCISPGPVETPVYQKLGLSTEEIAGFSKMLSEKILLKRFGQAEEIAQLAAFLGSDDSTFITGTEMVIDGGLIVNPVVQS